ncbi:MAG: RsmD family RNA methyltransferase [Sphingobacteriaceae bacterium]|jgi:16S rRNA (guanine(966)-N(2))-methyltransferase RsmD|nr:MAG: methyltransferase domain-containing protein [Pedobacter sp.]
MRIIGGRLRGLYLNPPKNLPVRPTTNLAKEALFNILNNRIDFEQIRVLDLFSGTGSISIEFASRGVPEIISVDSDFGCIKYLKTIAEQHHLSTIHPVKANVLKFLNQEMKSFDLIFVDPPYDLPQLPLIPSKIFEQNLLKPEGCLILEHPSMKNLDDHPHFKERRQYGSSSFSFFGHF